MSLHPAVEPTLSALPIERPGAVAHLRAGGTVMSPSAGDMARWLRQHIAELDDVFDAIVLDDTWSQGISYRVASIAKPITIADLDADEISVYLETMAEDEYIGQTPR